VTHIVPTSAAMEALGASIAVLSRAGDVFVLTGELGAGKTTFSRGFGEAMNLETQVSSPTFVVAREHLSKTAGAPPLVHIDAYRVGSAQEMDELDIDVPHSVVVAEWAAPFVSVLSQSWLELRFERPHGEAGDLEADQPRTVTLAGYGNSTDFFARIAPARKAAEVSRS
jgi:tRNA threonylcarbamoyladenosine biosynthesis protein TsaE